MKKSISLKTILRLSAILYLDSFADAGQHRHVASHRRRRDCENQ